MTYKWTSFGGCNSADNNFGLAAHLERQKEKEQFEEIRGKVKKFIISQRANTNEQIGLNSLLYNEISMLNLSARPANCLKNASIDFIGELVLFNQNKLRKIKDLGKVSIDEIEEKLLSSTGFKLDMQLEDFSDAEFIRQLSGK